jgi:carbamoyl-phosphate synthase large subunit
MESAIELDVDALCDGRDVYIGGILEHIEEAGIHSGDSACCIPPFSIPNATIETIRDYTHRLALAVGAVGLVNIQYAVRDSIVYVIEVNPRASRTVPFVSKATGVPLAKCAARIMSGQMIADMNLPDDRRAIEYFCVKEAVMPFGRFPGADVILGPEMKSTGEVMGIAKDFPAAYAKTQLAIDYSLPTSGCAFISVYDREKRSIAPIAQHLHKLGFELVSTENTAKVIRSMGTPVKTVRRFKEEPPNIHDMIAQGEIDLIINVPFGQEARGDGYHLRSAAVRYGISYTTTIAAASALVNAIEATIVSERNKQKRRMQPIALQDFEQFE